MNRRDGAALDGDPVFLDYGQDELDRNFDQRAWVDDADRLLARHARLSERARETLRGRLDIAYGSHPDEVLDFFPAAGPFRAIAIFIHGGAWRALTKASYSFVANAYVPAGIGVVVAGFSKLPGARMPEVVDQVRRVVRWTSRHAESLGGDAGDLHLIGHSSGAHLVMAALTADGAADAEIGGMVRSATCISGIYDLEPVMLSARRHYIELSADEVIRFSPIRQLHTLRCPVSIFFASADSMEFQRQSRAFAERLDSMGRLSSIERFDANHYDIVDMLDCGSTSLSRAIRRIIP